MSVPTNIWCYCAVLIVCVGVGAPTKSLFSGDRTDDIFDRFNVLKQSIKSLTKPAYNIKKLTYPTVSSAKTTSCTSFPDWHIKNGMLNCAFKKCEVKCIKQYAFPNGATKLQLQCVNGDWEFNKTEWTEPPPCQPICDTPCQNQGICIEPGRCACPDNFIGAFCEKKKQLCLSPPRLPKNSEIRIQATTCTITCRRGYVFPDQTSVTNMDCRNGLWIPSRPELLTVPDCQPTCKPECQNGGVCLSLNVCQCSPEHRGPLCQYDKAACNPKERLEFNGVYNCSGNSIEMKCDLSCPPDIPFEVGPSNPYTCKYETGKYLPSDLSSQRPQCKFPEGAILTPLVESSQSVYQNSSSQASASARSAKRKLKKVYYSSGGDDDEDDDESYERVITKTKIEIKRRKKPKKQKTGYYEIEEDIEDESFSDAEQINGIYSMYLMGGTSVTMRTPKSASCMAWNGNKVKTFDGLIYSAQLHCSHTLVQDIKDGTFSIILRSCRPGDGSCTAPAIEIIVDATRFTFEVNANGSLEVHSLDRKLLIPLQRPEIRANMLGSQLKVCMDSVGITLYWNLEQMITVESTAALWNRTGGLCGTMDQDPSNDFRSKDGTAIKTVTSFVDTWTTPTLDLDPKECLTFNADENNTRPTCDETKLKDAEKICRQLIASEKFDNCLKIVSKNAFIKACMSDYCSCSNTNNPAKCSCNSVAVLASDCQFRGVVFSDGWRNFDICPVSCPVGEIFRPCGPIFEPYCGSTVDETSTACREGCFCPDGSLRNEAAKCVRPEQCTCSLRGKIFQPQQKIKKDCNTCECLKGAWKCSDESCGARCGAIGDPHYQTFDNKRYDFMGKCSYTLLKSGHITIDAENVACSGQISADHGFARVDQPACTKSVTITLRNGTQQRNDRIRLEQGRVVTVNGELVKRLPVRIFGGVVRIREASSFMLTVTLYDGLQIWWDGVTNVYIDAPPAYRNRTSGLCGTFNANSQDDFLTPEGDVESAVAAFANKWRTKETCQFVPNGNDVPHPCQLNMENKEAAMRACAILKAKEFADCHWHVDPDVFYEDCMYDMCACKGQDVGKCLCPILSAYAAQCAQQGVGLNWRHNVRECAITCPIGQVFEECGDSCYRTCADRQFKEPCRKMCVEGCRCPFGQSLNDNGECVATETCPCLYNGMQFDAGYKEVRPGNKYLELCTCYGSNWKCKEAGDGDAVRYPAAADIMKLCANDSNSEFDTCKPKLPKTCKNMHDYKTPPASIDCQSGCSCKKGHVLDAFAQRCVLPANCGCHHGGKSYQSGERIRAKCNDCTCQKGAWQCTQHVCPATCTAWGDSHFESFDGKDFDFQGVCSYVLAKGQLGGSNGVDDAPSKESFSISIQNVLCGSMGVTCSKSVTISVLGAAQKLETITLTANENQNNAVAMAAIEGVSNVHIFDAGVFTIVELVGLDVQVKWDRGTRVYIRVGSRWQNHVKGLCGNFNGDAEDDLKTPAAGVEVSSTIFGHSWKLQEFCEKPKDQIDTCEAHPNRKVWSQRQCGILKSDVFQACHGEVNVERFMRRCVYDSCACDGGGDCECLCTAVAAYAHACAMKGVAIRWRTPTMCPMQCDPHCSEYSPCLTSSCPIGTCDDHSIANNRPSPNLVCQTDTCVEGCQLKACPAGHIYRNHSYTECVPKNVCRPICKTDGSITYFEGDVVASDACHTCRCSRGQTICSGISCTSPPPADATTTTARPYRDAGQKCIGGWTNWINRDRLDAAKTKDIMKFGDIEPLPDAMLLNGLNSPAVCDAANMTRIECRCVVTKQAPKETSEDVECSLERGLYAMGLVHDYEIRVRCECSEDDKPTSSSTTQQLIDASKPCDPSTPNVDFPGDCRKFLQCERSIDVWLFVEKACAPGTFFNPQSMICDWPDVVMKIKPECGEAFASNQQQIPKSDPTDNIDAHRICLPAQQWRSDLVPCNTTCHYYRSLLRRDALCLGKYETFQLGCVPKAEVQARCDWGNVWRDDKVCTDKAHCTCMSKSGGMVKPGAVVKESACETCQCINNDYVCDASHCDADVWTTAPLPTQTASTQTPDDILLVVGNTRSPPVQCERSRMKPIIDGAVALPDSIFSASSFETPNRKAHFARFSHAAKNNCWMPIVNDLKQYLKISLPQSRPIYGVITRGDALTDSFVTSFKILFSYDDIIYHPIAQRDGSPQIFRGPIDCQTPVESLLSVPIEAKFLHIYPLTWHNAIALQVEFLGCDESSDGIAVETTTTMPTIVDVIDEQPLCDEPMGVDNGQLGAENIRVSSFKSPTKAAAIDALKLSTPRGGWRPLLNTQNEYVLFDFLGPRVLTGVKTKGGPSGWVSAFNVKYSRDGITWNVYEDSSRAPKSFPANYDAITAKRVAFEKPISAQFFKIIPTNWHDTIELKLEPMGCFKSYPISSDLTVIEEPPNLNTTCGLCNGVLPPPNAIAGSCYCNEDLSWNGHGCVERMLCPCMVGHVAYEVGSRYKLNDCSDCTCLMGGHAQCDSFACPPCKSGLRSVKKQPCVCSCEPCGNGQVLCPTSGVCIPQASWCDGIRDCPDDERNCAAANVENDTIVKVVEKITVTKTCPKAVCPPGYDIKFTAADSDNSDSETEEDYTASIKYTTKKKTTIKMKNAEAKNWQPDTPRSLQDLPDTTRHCIKFKCIPVQASGYEVPAALVTCPRPQCPSGYDVKVAGASFASGCSNFTCELNALDESVCNVTGRTFNTFDGTTYKYDVCQHILARDLIANDWSIILTKNCPSPEQPCEKSIRIRDNRGNSSTTIRLTQKMIVTIDDYEYSIGQLAKSNSAKLKTYVVSKLGTTLVLRSHAFGFWATINSFGDVRLGVSKRLHLASVDGLCGYFNDAPADDKRSPLGGQLANTIEFGNSWQQLGEAGIVCETLACPKDAQSQALDICNQINAGAFARCAFIVDYDRFMEKCIEQTCECLRTAGDSAASERCRCDALQSYAIECLASTDDSSSTAASLASWRTEHDCPVTCPLGQHFNECYRRECEPTCADREACPLLAGTCFSGCYCPPGKVRQADVCIDVTECGNCECFGRGAAQLLTYDRQNVTGFANCTALLSRDRRSAVPAFEIFVQTAPCGSGSGECANGFLVVHGNNTARLQRMGPRDIRVLVDDRILEVIPTNVYAYDWLEIIGETVPNMLTSSLRMNVKLPRAQVHLQWTVPDGTYVLRVPSFKYAARLEGMCGNCNGDRTDDDAAQTKNDLTLAASKLIANAAELYKNEAAACSPPPAANVTDDCLILQDHCGDLLNNAAFARCHRIVDPQPFVGACRLEMCAQPKNAVHLDRLACQHARIYAEACAQSDLCIEWQCDAAEARVKCPAGMHYEACGCPVTCDSVNAQQQQQPHGDSNKCSTGGCVCTAPGTAILDGRCVVHAACRQCDAAGHGVGDKWRTDKCTQCECQADGSTKCVQQQCPLLLSAAERCANGAVPRHVVDEQECCPRVVCEQVPPAQLVDCTNATTVPVKCSANQRLNRITDLNGCDRKVCECIPPVECPPLLRHPDNLQPGESIDADATDGCCPVHKIKCDTTKCHQPPYDKPQQCPAAHEEVHAVQSNGSAAAACCPQFECRAPKDKCLILSTNGFTVVKLAHEEWPTANACVSQRCSYDATGQARVVDVPVVCAPVQCDAPGWSLQVAANECCARCVQTQCVYEGVVIGSGASMRSADNCSTWRCTSVNGTFIVETVPDICPSIGACPAHLRVQNGCCVECQASSLIEDQKTCVVVPVNLDHTVGLVERTNQRYGICRNRKKIEGFTECHGACKSGTRFDRGTLQQTKHCACCQVAEYASITVPLDCDTGAKLDIVLNVPKSCTCLPCDNETRSSDALRFPQDIPIV